MESTLVDQVRKSLVSESYRFKLRAVWLFVVALTMTGLSSQELLAQAYFGIGYSSNMYDFTDNATDVANTAAAGGSANYEEEDGIVANVIMLPKSGKGWGYELGLQSFSVDTTYTADDNTDNYLLKQINGSVFYFNAVYCFELSKATKLFIKGGLRFGQSDLSVETSGSGLATERRQTNKIEGTSDGQTLMDSGYGTGFIYAPSSSNFGLLIKYENFGRVVEDYENDQFIEWTSDGKLVSSGDLDLASVSVSFTYKIQYVSPLLGKYN